MLNSMEKLGAKTIFDVGANIGNWSLKAAHLNPRARIHAFELNSETADKMEAAISKNSRIALNRFGLSDENQPVEFLSFENSAINSLLVNENIHESKSTSKTSQVRTGDSYCEENEIDKIDFLKIDTEGAEKLVLAGFPKMLARKAIRVIQFEYGYANLSARYFMSDFVKMFDAIGYRVAPIRSNGIPDEKYNVTWNNFESGPNYIAFSKDDAAAIDVLSIK